MLELVTLTPAFGMRNVSPFCLKIEMLLTQLNLPFKITQESDPRKAPKAKLPYMIADGRTIADSELIMEYLDETTQGQVYAGLTEGQKAQGFAYARLAEDHLYWIMVASRWLDDEWWPNVVKDFFGELPSLIRGFISRMARKQMRRTYHLQGLGRHSMDEQRGFAKRDLQSLQTAVGDSGFLFTEAPCVFDFAIAGMMAGVYDNKPATWVSELAEQYPDLRSYTERVQAAVGVYGRDV